MVPKMRIEAPHTVDSDPIALSLLFQRVWPPAIVILGSVLTLAWICLLGYGIVTLIKAL